METLEKEATENRLILRIKVSRPLGLWSVRVVVADYLSAEKVRILGEMKAWAYRGVNGLQLDTMRVSSNAPSCVGHLLWASIMAWALENTPCRKARLLAICDDPKQHQILVRYFLRRGFQKIRSVGSSPMDLPLRMIWGGAGELMVAECSITYEKSYSLWTSSVQN